MDEDDEKYWAAVDRLMRFSTAVHAVIAGQEDDAFSEIAVYSKDGKSSITSGLLELVRDLDVVCLLALLARRQARQGERKEGTDG